LGATVQVYVVFTGMIVAVGLFVNVNVNASPLQIVAVCIGTTGFGFTVTVTVNGAPMHVPDVGVTVYTTVCTVFVLFVSV
jgi:hypothetical protein